MECSEFLHLVSPPRPPRALSTRKEGSQTNSNLFENFVKGLFDSSCRTIYCISIRGSNCLFFSKFARSISYPREALKTQSSPHSRFLLLGVLMHVAFMSSCPFICMFSLLCVSACGIVRGYPIIWFGVWVFRVTPGPNSFA